MNEYVIYSEEVTHMNNLRKSSSLLKKSREVPLHGLLLSERLAFPRTVEPPLRWLQEQAG